MLVEQSGIDGCKELVSTRHLKHVTRHTSHVTRYTSHVTRHTSHVTSHTSHVTGQLMCWGRSAGGRLGLGELHHWHLHHWHAPTRAACSGVVVGIVTLWCSVKVTCSACACDCHVPQVYRLQSLKRRKRWCLLPLQLLRQCGCSGVRPFKNCNI